MIEHIPSLTQDRWEINGDSLTAWISKDELFDIRPADDDWNIWTLHISSIKHVQSVYLGSFDRISEAQKAARIHLGDDDEG